MHVTGARLSQCDVVDSPEIIQQSIHSYFFAWVSAWVDWKHLRAVIPDLLSIVDAVWEAYPPVDRRFCFA